ncbi:hypothetical protein [Nostoc sp. KVJ20]|nr:hypothetical protein [Nostoc sp. KVJ20]
MSYPSLSADGDTARSLLPRSGKGSHFMSMRPLLLRQAALRLS